MKNWKTSLLGILAFLCFNGELIGLSDKQVKLISGIAVASGLIVSKDRDVTGVGSQARRQDEIR